VTREIDLLDSFTKYIVKREAFFDEYKLDWTGWKASARADTLAGQVVATRKAPKGVLHDHIQATIVFETSLLDRAAVNIATFIAERVGQAICVLADAVRNEPS
jgi:hypothetical protein